MDGTVQERAWVPVARNAANAAIVAMLATAALPYAGGIAIGYLHPPAVIIVTVGMGLWLLQMIVAFVFAHRRHQQVNRSSLLYAISTVFTFGAAYGLAVVISTLLRNKS